MTTTSKTPSHTQAVPESLIPSAMLSRPSPGTASRFRENESTQDRECPTCWSRRETTRPITPRSSTSAPASPREVLESPGQPLDRETRAFFEPRFGHNFSDIQVHTDHEAASSARSINAIAYTAGRHIVFGSDQYAPRTPLGRAVLAHELAHAVQQSAAPSALPSKLGMTSASDAAEQEATVVATRTLRGEPASPSIRQTPRIARQGTPPAAPPACAVPVNWRHINPRDHGADAIQIDILWDSSTGNLADLGSCTVREVVNYDPIPNPPFLWNPPNPTILTVPGRSGAGTDTHSYPPGLRTGITDPRVEGTMTANQVYQYRCTGPGCSNTWTGFPGQTYRITRQVAIEFVWQNPERYIIRKTGTGAGNRFNYSRNVEIPPP